MCRNIYGALHALHAYAVHPAQVVAVRNMGIGASASQVVLLMCHSPCRKGWCKRAGSSDLCCASLKQEWLCMCKSDTRTYVVLSVPQVEIMMALEEKFEITLDEEGE